MTAFSIRTTPRARTALLAACAAVTLGATAAHADFAKTGAAGYWTAGQGTNDQGVNVCMILTRIPSLGETLAIVTSADNQQLRVVAIKDSWNIPSNAEAKLAVQIDSNPIWRAPGTAMADKTRLVLGVDPSAARGFVHEITAGTTLRVFFSGTEQPWTLGLSGTTGVWPQFMNCAQMVAPAMVASLNATQPFAAQGPAQPVAPTKPTTQPFAPAPAPKPSQPFERSA